MKKKRSGIKLNWVKNNKSNKNIVLIVIASIAAALGTAVFGILKWKGKNGADDKSTNTADSAALKASDTTISDTQGAFGIQDKPVESRPQPPARFAHRKLQPGELDWETLAKEKEAEQIRKGEIPDYMLKGFKRPKFMRGFKKRNWKIALSSLAMLLAVAVVCGNIAQYLRPAKAVAKESFTGIGKIVEEHGEDNPYKILDIVPSEVTISDFNDATGPVSFTFTTGTLGYLAGGKVPFADELKETFNSNQSYFRYYDNRINLFNKLVPSPSSFPQIRYEEAYGGVHDVSESNGWTLLFEPLVQENGSVDTSEMSNGVFYGKWKKVDGGEFESINGTNSGSLNISGLSNKFVYIYFEGNEDDPAHWYPVDIATYYESYLPNDTPAYMPKADSARMITIGENGPDCSSSDYVYKFDGQVYLPVDPAAKVEALYNSIAAPPENPEPVDTQPKDDSTETLPVNQEQPAIDSSTGETTTEQPSAEEQTSDANDVALLDSRNTVFTGGWRRLVEGENGDTQTPSSDNPEENGDQGGNDNPGGNEEQGGSDNPGGNGEQGGSDNPGGNEEQGGSDNPGGNGEQGGNDNPDGTGEQGGSDNPGESGNPEGAGNQGETKQPEQPKPPVEGADMSNTEGFGEMTSYYVFDANSFVPLGAEELAAMLAGDSVEAGELGDENGIMLLDASDSGTPAEENKFIYVGSGKGHYELEATGKDSGLLIGVYNAPVYFRCQAGNDWLRKYVFSSLSGGDNANSSFRIDVTTVRADKVTAEMVADADLVYMESGQNTFLNTNSLSVSYIQPDDASDMKADVVSAILSRAADDLMPVIMDYDITEDTNYADTNYQLLAKALLKRDLADYFEAVNVGKDFMDNLEMNIDADEFPNKYSNEFKYSYVNQNIYVVKDEPLVSENFADYFDDFTANAGFGDVLAAIEMENLTLAEEDRISPAVSKARAIQYIINFSVGIMGEFDDLTILELQPSANIDSETGGVVSDLHIDTDTDKNNTRLYWKTDSMKTGKQILYSKKAFSVATDVKSVVEFNGEWEDINGTYDMIFIGLDGMNLNLSNEKGRRPIYNNSDLNGKAYHLGDDSGSGTYDSNDITAQKMSDLLDYLQAGYPIVVENDFFTTGTARGASEENINTEYIAEDTCMYMFLSAAVSDERYRDSIFTVSDTTSSAMFMARMKTAKPRIELTGGDNAEDSQAGNRIQSLRLDENNVYHGRIAFEVKNNRDEEYLGSTQTRLYVDMNYDGIFGLEEELREGYVDEGNVIDVTISGMGPGIVPWKLEVADTGNAYRRDSIQGYFELLSSYPEEVRVLQVTKDIKNPFVALQEMYDRKEDSMLAHYLRGAEGNANLSFEFESVTPDMLSARLGENDKYLNQWDIVVLTVDDGVAVDNTAFTNYINEGRSLLVCSQNKNGNSAGLTPGMLGWSEGRTFVSLGASNLHRYANLKSEMYEAQHGNLKAEKINEGSILYYPYQLSSSSFNFGNTESGLRASEYLLDFENNLKSERTEAYVTTWLTLGGNTNTAYGLSPRDARNNYYCYSKGNVIYLAQSEYQYIYDAANNENPDGKEGSDECKFFVNALMAAYSAGVHSSDVSIVAGFAQDSAPLKSISVPFDQEWRETADDGTQGILDNTVDVYFKFADSNIGVNKKVTVSFYYEDPMGEREIVIDDKVVKATQFNSDIWTVTDNKLVPVTPGDPQNPDQAGLVPGKVYQIKAPVIALRNLSADKDNNTTNNAGIYVLVESEFTRTGKTYKMEGFGTVSLNRATLFLLE